MKRDTTYINKIPNKLYLVSVKIHIWKKIVKSKYWIESQFFLQINFFKDHTKVILCPLMGAVTYIDGERKARTFRLDLIEKFGCSEELTTRLIYCFEKVDNMIKSNSNTKQRIGSTAE